VLRDFLLALGTAYQAIDDVINVAGLHNNAKERGEDLRTGRRPCISSSLLSHTEASALGIPASVISSVQDLSRPLVDVLNRGGKGWRG
jgi:geranylgeranyl pyrophosphate synthase